MMRSCLLLLGFLFMLGHGPEAWALSPKAAALRRANGLVAFTPPEKFLTANFVADEMHPTVIFGSVQAFAAARPCPTTWLIEALPKKPAAGTGGQDPLMEYTLYLEEDCPDKVIYYVFIDQSGLTPQQWLAWREKFHKSKTEPEYGQAKSKLEKACQDGCGFGAELRFIQRDGELLAKSPEAVLLGDLKVVPVYDLNLEKKIPR